MTSPDDAAPSGNLPSDATPIAAEGRDDLLDALRGPDGTVPRPLEVAVAFVEVIDSDPHVSRLSLDDLVTPETKGQWDVAEASKALADVGFASKVAYLGDEWARVVLVRGVERAYRIPAAASVEVPAYGLYLRKVDDNDNWRVHRLGAADLTAEDLAE